MNLENWYISAPKSNFTKLKELYIHKKLRIHSAFIFFIFDQGAEIWVFLPYSTRLHLGFSAKLKNLASSILQDGATEWHYSYHILPTHPTYS